MKRMLSVLMGVFIALNVQAQTLDEWFKQKETQIKYLAEQVAALRLYGSTVKKGYDLVNGRLKDIGRLKESDFQLHQEHLASLFIAKPGVQNSEVIRRIIALQAAMVGVYRECKGKVSRAETFSKEEQTYFNGVLDNGAVQCKAAGDEALLLISEGQLQMQDDERLKRLQMLSSTMEDLYIFLKQFRNNIAIAVLNRLKEQKNVTKLKSLF